MQFIFFWMLSPYDPSVSQSDWDNYLNLTAWITVLIALVTVAAVTGLYAYSARQRKIRIPADLFQPYRCMWWLFLSIPAAIGAGITAALNFSQYCGDDATGVIPASISVGLETFVLCFLVGYAIILIPAITPSAFKYRPREWLFQRKAVR